MKRRGISRLQSHKSGTPARRLHFCAAALLAAAGLSACSTSDPPSLPSLAEPVPPGESAGQTAMAPKAGARPAVSASEPTGVNGATPGQIAGFRSSTVILYSSDVGTDGQKVPVSTLPLPMPIAAMSASKKRLAIHTVEGIRWIAMTDVVVPGHAPDVAPATARKTKAPVQQ